MVLKDVNLDRISMRELVPNQKHTRNAIALYNVLDGVDGFADTELFEKLYPNIQDVLISLKVRYGYSHLEIKSLMLVKLYAYGDISEHIDEAGIYKYAHRVHIPLITNDRCVFTIDGEEGRMSKGEIVEINNIVPHSVVNGDQDRVHLIMDIIGLNDRYNVEVLNTPIPKEFYYEEK